ncbi:hypothetical protein D0Z00_001983 [Geotrichum galactomycetum]|uniref:Uncharacterized protein n=1 Tax=Geotrichum galactomycetum TaxID=27317 RepID=A0ACB6V5P4_9ASCO|nr:hypothetical protein D0Z00_001983 [Geotrichum candidum]
MSANLDKSLDEIISSKPRTPRGRGGRKSVSVRKGVSKSAAPSAAKKAVAKKAAPAAAPKLNVLDEASKLADRIIISNLISYNSKGQSTGVVTITFKTPGHAHKATVRFNGTSIDNGAKFMKPRGSKATKATKVNTPRSKGPKAEASKPKATKTRTPRRPKKTLEELDAEMADYFDNKS